MGLAGIGNSRHRPCAQYDPRVIREEERNYRPRDAVFSDCCSIFGMTTMFGNPGSTELPMFRGFPDRFPLRAGAPGVAGRRHGRRLRAGSIATPRSSICIPRSASGMRSATCSRRTKNQTPLVITAGPAGALDPAVRAVPVRERGRAVSEALREMELRARARRGRPAAIARAYYVAMQAPRGPTFVSVPVDDWDRLCEPLEPRRVSRVTAWRSLLLAEAAQALEPGRAAGDRRRRRCGAR